MYVFCSKTFNEIKTNFSRLLHTTGWNAAWWLDGSDLKTSGVAFTWNISLMRRRKIDNWWPELLRNGITLRCSVACPYLTYWFSVRTANYWRFFALRSFFSQVVYAAFLSQSVMHWTNWIVIKYTSWYLNTDLLYWNNPKAEQKKTWISIRIIKEYN